VADYSFVTLWRVAAPIERVWQAIAEVERWPDWWKAIARVEVVQPGAPDGMGRVVNLTFRTALPYGFTFQTETVRVDPPRILEAHAAGDLEGMGLWTLTPEAGGTLVRYDWNVRINRRWLNFIAPLARPAFNWNHDVTMRWGAEGLARYLGVAVAQVELKPPQAAATA
jgi:uncharacterized protein YndB with AHSA1/START domain